MVRGNMPRPRRFVVQPLHLDRADCSVSAPPQSSRPIYSWPYIFRAYIVTALHSYGLYICGLYSYGLYSYGLLGERPIVLVRNHDYIVVAYTVVTYIVMACERPPNRPRTEP